MEPARGALVTPQVRLLAPLGRGGMGAVWAAEHLGLGSRVAVKFIAPERLERDPRLRERLQREARVGSRLSSPHALRVYDCGETPDRTPFIVMEHLQGETLAARLARRERLELGEVGAIVSQVASVLAGAHANGVIHRDVKPDNLFLVDAGYDVFVKVLDFGVAKELRAEEAMDLTTTGSMVGTPQYMAPEQLLGARAIDERCDIWSLGVVAYHALVGRRPFDGPTVAALALAVCQGTFTPASELVSGIAPAIDRWFGRSLSIAADGRFRSVEEQARAFLDAAGLRDVGPRRVEPAVRPESTPPAGPDPAQTEGVSTLGATASRVDPRPGRRTRALALVGALAVIGVGGSLMGPQDGPGADDEVVETARLVVVEDPQASGSATVAVALAPAVAPAAAAPAASTSQAAPGTPQRSPARPSDASGVKARTTPVVSATGHTAQATVKPAYCETDDGFTVDGRGHLRPKPECLR